MKSNGPVRAATRFGALRTGKVESKNPRLTKSKRARLECGISQSQGRKHVILAPISARGRASTSRAHVQAAHKSYREPMKFSKSLALIFGLLLVAGAAVPGA